MKSSKRLTPYPTRPGTPVRLGSFRRADGVNFSIDLEREESLTLLLYDEGADEAFQRIEIPASYRTGRVAAVHVEIPADRQFTYNYRIDDKERPDPYARVICEHIRADGSTSLRASIMPDYKAKTDQTPHRYAESIFYKLHVRGFTIGEGAGVRHPGTFSGVKEKIPYLKKLGVTSVILMPVYEFNERPAAPEGDAKLLFPDAMPAYENRRNFWGYTGGYYYAPKRSYCATDNAIEEFGSLVDALHEEKIECIPEFYFAADTPAWFVVNVLQYWRMVFNIDGVRLIGYGNWINAVINDPILSFSKIFYVNYEGATLYAHGQPLFRNLAQANPDYEMTMRRFLKGDIDAATEARMLMRDNPPSYARINYFADHDGLNMYDMVSYNEKHNEANGEENRDGALVNNSWNCGVEGETKGRKVNNLRARQLRNAHLMLLSSQGAPMIYAGDEFCNSQDGNNNAWCQDNPTGWVTWKKGKAARDLQAFVTAAIAFRKEHPILAQQSAMKLSDVRGVGFPDLSYHGRMAWRLDEKQSKCAFGALYCGRDPEDTRDDFVYLIYNQYWQEQEFAIPDLPEGLRWRVAIDTTLADSFRPPSDEVYPADARERRIIVPERAITVLVAEADPDAGKSRTRKKASK